MGTSVLQQGPHLCCSLGLLALRDVGNNFLHCLIMAASISVLLALLPRVSGAENWHFIEGREISVLGDDGDTVP